MGPVHAATIVEGTQNKWYGYFSDYGRTFYTQEIYDSEGEALRAAKQLRAEVQRNKAEDLKKWNAMIARD